MPRPNVLVATLLPALASLLATAAAAQCVDPLVQQQAVGQVLGEAGQREVATLAQAYAFKARAEAAEAKVADLTKQLAAAKAAAPAKPE